MSKHSVNDSVHWYMNELTSRIVAESGIPSDRFHLGKILLQSLKDDPDLVLQVGHFPAGADVPIGRVGSDFWQQHFKDGKTY